MSHTHETSSNRFNPALLKHLPRDARVVLDVGCGNGALGAAYLAFNPECYFLGIEVDPDVGASAKSRISTVVVADVESLQRHELPLDAGQDIDVIIYGNVLEHLLDPWKTLTRQVNWLAPDGLILASIPNIQHWSILDGLLRGEWQYRDEGLLDRCSLRNFTLDTVHKLFEGAGLFVHDIIPRVFTPPAFAEFQKAIAPTLLALGINSKKFASQTGVLQYVVRAGRAPITRRLYINTLTRKPVAGLNDVRINQPLQFQATIPGTYVNIQVASNNGNDFPSHPGTDRVLVWQRPILTRPHSIQALRRLHQNGTVLVVEFDDHPEPFSEIAAHDYLTFRAAHAIQTSTEVLAAVLRQWNPEVEVFPNCVSKLPSPPAQSRSFEGDVVIFFGALNREDDWAPIMPELNSILVGPLGARVRVEVVHDRAFFDALATNNKRFTATCPYNQYLELLANADISILPLADTTFNRAKSDLKFIEAAAQGVAVLASPVVYGHTLQHRKTGLIFVDPKTFSEGLSALITDPNLRYGLVVAAYSYVAAERLLAQHFRRRQSWYKRLLADRNRLTTEIGRRVPELIGSDKVN